MVLNKYDLKSILPNNKDEFKSHVDVGDYASGEDF